MANDFTTIQQNQSSKKFFLVKLEPARHVTDDLTDNGGGEYEMSFAYDVSRVFQNDTEFTLVTGTPSAGEYSYSNGTLTLNTSTAPDADNVIIVYYHLYYTGERNRVVGRDPETPTVNLRDWEPLIKIYPEIATSIENILTGTITIQASSLVLINDDFNFQQYLTEDDSFYLKTIQIWHCLDSVENIQKIFEGRITGVKVSRRDVTFRIEDNLSMLSTPAFLDAETKYQYFTKGDYSGVDPNKAGLPVRYYIGPSSRYQLIAEQVDAYAGEAVEPGSLDEAICISYDTEIINTNNRTWGIGRVSSNGFLDFSFTPSAVTHAGGVSEFTGTAAEIAKFKVGDTFHSSGSGERYGRVMEINTSTNKLICTDMSGFTSGDVIEANNCPTIVVVDGNDYYYPNYKTDYTATVETTAAGNKYVRITFADNFESGLSMPILDPGVMQVRFRIRPNTTDAKHGSVAQLLLEDAGLTVNTTDISNANTSFAVDCAFSIPFYDEIDYAEYFRYLEELCKSAFSFIYLDNDFKIGYKLFTTPSSTDTITDTDILENLYNIEIEYKDIVTKIIAYNPHYSADDVNDDSGQTQENVKSRHLHGVDKTTRFRHVLTDYTNKIDDIINVRSERLALYSFTTKLLTMDSEIGDDFLLSKDGILGNDATKNVKILALEKAATRTRVLTSDFYNL